MVAMSRPDVSAMLHSKFSTPSTLVYLVNASENTVTDAFKAMTLTAEGKKQKKTPTDPIPTPGRNGENNGGYFL